MGVKIKIPPEDRDLLVTVKKKIKVPLDEKLTDTPLPVVEEYLKSHVFKDLVELEGVLIKYKDIQIKGIKINPPDDPCVKLRAIFTVLRIAPGRRLTAKFVGARDGLLVCNGFDLAVHIKDKKNLGQHLSPGSLIQYTFSSFKNENNFLILYGKKPMVVPKTSISLDKDKEAQTTDEDVTSKKRKKEGNDQSSSNKRMKPAVGSVEANNEVDSDTDNTEVDSVAANTEVDRVAANTKVDSDTSTKASKDISGEDKYKDLAVEGYHPGFRKNVLSKVCPLCGKIFTRGYDMKRHLIRFHKEDKTEKCDFCDKSFKWKGDLKEHMSVHGKGKVHKCDCGEKFKFRDSLVFHRKKCNNEEPTHKCAKCGKGFYKSTCLTRHLLQHKGVKPFQCQFCPRKFYQESTRKHHLKVCVNREAAENPHLYKSIK